MATIEVKGFATRIFFEDRGVEVTEFFTTKDGEQAQRKYTAWFEKPVQFSVGAEGVFSGLLSAQIDEWKNADGTVKLNREGKPGISVKVSINGASFVGASSPIPAPKVNVPASWAKVDDAPF